MSNKDLGKDNDVVSFENLETLINYKDDTVILSEKFIYHKSKQSVKVSLYKSFIKFFNLKNSNQEIDCETAKPDLVLNIYDIAGTSIGKGHNKSDNKSYLTIYSYLKNKTKPNESKRKRFVVELACSTSENYDDNFILISKWNAHLSNLIKVNLYDSKLKQQLSKEENSVIKTDNINKIDEFFKPFLILINPKSGAGKAKSIYYERVTPVWSESNQPDTVVFTSKFIF
jgi:hypothetical protein